MNAKSATPTSRQVSRSVCPSRLGAVIATLAFSASASCFAASFPVAGAGEAQDIALPTMRVGGSPADQSSNMSSADAASTAATVVNPGTTNSVVAKATAAATRASVRSELAAARANGSMNLAGEIGDNSSTVLAAREQANNEQADAIVAEYRSEYNRTVALQEAEQLRAAIETAGALDASLASAGYGGDEAYVPSGFGDEPVDTSAVRIDVIRMESDVGAVKPEEELVVVSMPYGDEATQMEQAAAIRRQLGDMGVAQDQVYIEAAPERD